MKLLRETLCKNTDELLQFNNRDTKLQTESKQDVEDENILLDVVVKDIAGGLYAWANHIDKDFPMY